MKQSTPLKKANQMLREGKYEDALSQYELALSLYPSLHKVIIPTLEYAKRRIQNSANKIIHKAKLDCPPQLERYFFEIIKESGLFDPVWYMSEYGNKYDIQSNPLAHYLDFGVENGLNPSLKFDTKYYLKSNPDVVAAGINPFIHYASQGSKEGRSPLPPSHVDDECNYQIEEPRYVPRISDDFNSLENSVSVIAFYLPQFHPIPENDEWWGKGFTEWTNVKPAKPQFDGHYQPHIPDDFLGYYDLRDISYMHKQVELARQYGIEGFCFYSYWFTGHRLLETPVENYLKDSTLDFPFCICWANENWSRRWDGQDQDILIAQNYSNDDDLNFISNVARYLRDPRYIRVDGKPLLMVYRPQLFPDIQATANRWREWCRDNEVGEIYLVYPQSFESVNPSKYGFDAACEFPPNNSKPPDITNNVSSIVEDFQTTVYDWRIFLARSEKYVSPGYKLFRSVTPSWDNTARKKNKGTVFANSCPKLFRKWLINAFVDTCNRFEKKDERLVFVNAWNEWAEGAHLEPDNRYGYAWLDAVRLAHYDLKIINSRHAAIQNIAWNKVVKLTGDINKESFNFFIDYLPVLRKASALGARWVDDGNSIICHLNEKQTLIKNRADLYSLVDAIYDTSDCYCFVILQFNKSSYTIKCVDSIISNFSGLINFKIVIVDNGSNYDELNNVRSKYCNIECVEIISSPTNVGFSAGNNLGYKHARNVLRAKFCIIINNDTEIVDSDFVDTLLNIYKDCCYSILGPDIQVDSRHENPWNNYVYDTNDLVEFFQRRTKEREDYLISGEASFEKVGFSNWNSELLLNPLLQGAAYILSPIFIDTNESVFDESLFLYGEEFLLASHCLINGYLTAYSNRLKVSHLEGGTTVSMPAQEKIMLGYDSSLKSIELCLNRLSRCEQAAIGASIDVRDSEKITTIVSDGRKHVLVDLLFCQPGYHGGGEYGKAVFKALLNKYILTGDFQLWVAINSHLYIDRWVWDACAEFGVNVVSVESYSDIVDVVNLDLFYSFFTPAIVVYTGYEYMKNVGNELPFSVKNTRVIGTLHDIRDYELMIFFPEIYNLRKSLGCRYENSIDSSGYQKILNRNSIYMSDLKVMYSNIIADSSVEVVTISEYCRKSIIEKIGLPANPMLVSMSPMKVRPKPTHQDLSSYGIGESGFCLLLHASRKEKNAVAVVRAFESIFDEGEFEGLKIILTGINTLEDLDIDIEKYNDRFIPVGEVAPESLEFFLKETKLLIYPSLNEGLGYPPIEALTYGTPCIASNITAIPETCGNLIYYFDPYEQDSIISGITKALTSKRDIDVAKVNDLFNKQNKDLNKLCEKILYDR